MMDGDQDLTEKLLADDGNGKSSTSPLVASGEAEQEEPIIAVKVPDDDEERSTTKSDTSRAEYESLPTPEFQLDPQQVFDSQDYARGERQPNQCRDFPFALLWYAQLIAIIVVAVVLGIPALSKQIDNNNEDTSHDSDDDDDDGSSYSYAGVLYFTLLSSAASFLLNAVAVAFLMQYGHFLIQMSLLFSVFVSLGMAILAALQGSIFLAVISAVCFLIGCCYYYAVYNRIPFAAANLNTGLTAVKKNMGCVLVAYACVALSLIFSAIWTIALIGVADKYTPKCNGNNENCHDGIDEGILFVFLVSLFWTQQVLSNVVHVAVAGVVGTWWFAPDEASSFCSSAVTDSFVRATTTSFGSICFGSLLVAVVKALRQIVQNARQDDSQDNTILLCIAECILACLEGLIQYFNKWSFIYVGLYGYDYITAGRNVMSLFDARGWTVIINDDMVSNTLSLTCLVLGSLSGCVGMLICALQGGSWLDVIGASRSIYAAFALSFVLGLITSSILMGVVDSAVSTAIVSFAEAPSDFQQNHPALYEEMVGAWRRVYADDCGF